MAHSLTHAVAPLPTRTRKNNSPCSFGLQKIVATHHQNSQQPLPRRDVGLGLAGALFGLSIVGDRSADAATRRPPPPPPTEKTDPNVSGVLAKVIASKKRKEAMKDSMAKLRAKGKAIIEPGSSSPSAAE